MCLAWVPSKEIKRSLYHRLAITIFRCLSRLIVFCCNNINSSSLFRCFSAEIQFHDIENRAQCDGICVANHTSPIDVLILSTDRPYSMVHNGQQYHTSITYSLHQVGQTHGGLLGLCQRSLSLGASHIWFQRSEVSDRVAVSKR